MAQIPQNRVPPVVNVTRMVKNISGIADELRDRIFDAYPESIDPHRFALACVALRALNFAIMELHYVFPPIQEEALPPIDSEVMREAVYPTGNHYHGD